MSEKKPVLGILMGDSAGVGPELVAKLAAENFYADYCRPVIIGDIIGTADRTDSAVNRPFAVADKL